MTKFQLGQRVRIISASGDFHIPLLGRTGKVKTTRTSDSMAMVEIDGEMPSGVHNHKAKIVLLEPSECEEIST